MVIDYTRRHRYYTNMGSMTINNNQYTWRKVEAVGLDSSTIKVRTIVGTAEKLRALALDQANGLVTRKMNNILKCEIERAPCALLGRSGSAGGRRQGIVELCRTCTPYIISHTHTHVLGMTLNSSVVVLIITLHSSGAIKEMIL